jgi:hypothetical protein
LIHWVIGVFLLMGAGGYAARRTNHRRVDYRYGTSGSHDSRLEMTFAYSDLMPWRSW